MLKFSFSYEMSDFLCPNCCFLPAIEAGIILFADSTGERTDGSISFESLDIEASSFFAVLIVWIETIRLFPFEVHRSRNGNLRAAVKFFCTYRPSYSDYNGVT